MTAVEAALAGAAVLTSSKRLSRALTQELHRAQRAAGLSVWRTVPILPLNAFVGKCFKQWLYSGRDSSFPVLLNSAQETALWENIIRAADGDRLLQPGATAAAAKHAWELAARWRVPVSRANFAVSEDCEAFSGWAARFTEKCRNENWLDSARLPDFVRSRIAAGEIDVPSHLALAGFDELTPQQCDLVEALRGTSAAAGQLGLFAAPLRIVEQCEQASFQSTPVVAPMRDSLHELGAAAEWARDILMRDPRARIGVIVPDLASVRERVDRVFGDVLQPGAFAETDKPYHISAGRPLADYPLVHAALRLLQAGHGSMPVSDAGMLLRSPFLKGGMEERNARALADVKLRESRAAKVTFADLRNKAASCPILLACLDAFEREVRAVKTEQAPSSWSGAFARLLGAVGWPGDRVPESHEYQTMRAWNEALSTLSTLDIVSPSLDYYAALSRLRRIADSTIFQPESEGAPVQIMGTLEAAGLTFDHAWITGFDVPRAARPNPFLPLAIQRQRGMPHCSAERELVFWRQTLDRLVASAPDVVLSSASVGECGSSPELLRASSPGVGRRGRSPAAPVEEIEDAWAPPLDDARALRGGASVLKAVAACPFQAFAKYRLNARGLEEGDFGISALQKGIGLHDAMRRVWTELRSHQGLLSRSADELRDVVVRSVAAAVPDADALASIERERLETVILHWLQEIEARRPPFTVESCERNESVCIGDLPLQVRVDRMDRLPDGRFSIVDYKTGVVNSGGWEGERPAEPQLPLYAATCNEPLAAVLIAQVRRDEPGYRGIADVENMAIKPMRCATGSLATERVEWTRVLTALAGQFRAGDARVDPAKGVCKLCDFRALCRVDETGAAEENGNGAE